MQSKSQNLFVRYALQVKFGYARTYNKCERFSEAFSQKNFSVYMTSFISVSTNKKRGKKKVKIHGIQRNEPRVSSAL